MKIIDKYNMLSPNIGHRIYDSEDIIRFIYLFRKSQLKGLINGGPATIHLCVMDDSPLDKEGLFNQYGYPDDLPAVFELFANLSLSKNITYMDAIPGEMTIEVSESEDHSTNITGEVITSIGWLFQSFRSAYDFDLFVEKC